MTPYLDEDRRRTYRLGVYLTPRELELLKKESRRLGYTVSGYVRMLIQDVIVHLKEDL